MKFAASLVLVCFVEQYRMSFNIFIFSNQGINDLNLTPRAESIIQFPRMVPILHLVWLTGRNNAFTLTALSAY